MSNQNKPDFASAAKNGELKNVEILVIQNGDDLEGKDKYGETVFYTPAFRSHMDVMKFMKEKFIKCAWCNENYCLRGLISCLRHRA